ncbi:Fatty acyl-CoA synthetase A [Tritrichomonas foetus]|uniref:Fatty acyl-CoA synthetase A n=1 Tax=Tritrichomonas foetus TaxID=1144522 RepID=A0A1J4KJC7_9EUKA|nr:Fatty acyl-CoA synthetase A [Tritrichomonas foetus]|eukprot:OHT11194.1 Fatty acyl-CoA synthetase A [Tritrichomonas foetus]
MGCVSSAPPSYVTYSSNETGVEVTPYTIRRHPNFASGVLQLPADMPNGQALYLQSMKKYADREYVGNRKVVNGQRQKEFTFIKYKEAFEISKAFGAGLVKYGVQNASYVCIFSENRPEWILTMDASYLYGYVTVALYDTFTTDALEFSIQNCQAEYIVCSKKNLTSLMKCSDDVLKQFKLVVFFDEVTEAEPQFKSRLESIGVTLKTFAEIQSEGKGLSYEYPSIEPEQLLYVCYSSGTTGFPKGVMISHRSFITNLLGISAEGTNKTFERHLSYLPLCHVFERMCTSCALLSGGKIGTFSGDVRLLSDDLRSLRPTCMIVVPRVLHRMHDAVMNEVNKKGFIMRTIFNTAWHIKRLLMLNEMNYSLIDKMVFNRVKEVMGSMCIEQIVNGGAALPVDLHETMQVMLGIPIRTGYGLSEGGSGNTLNPLKIQHIKYGTNGYPLRNVELRIVQVPEFTDPGVGEIQMGGTCLCSGYLNDEEATNNLFTDETHTWIHTGDIGKFDEQNSLLVVDRMRSIFKLSQGEYVAGDLLATYFEGSPLIEHIFVYGDSTRPYLVGIVIPYKPEVARFLGKDRITDEELEQACNSKELNERIMQDIGEIAKEKKLLGYQRINSICIKFDEWTIDNGILSPTFKPKRKVLSERYKKEIDALYSAQKK